MIRDATTADPIAGALVSLDSSTRSSRSSSDGAFRLPAVAPGTHNLIVRRIGYAELEFRVITSGRDTTVTILLDPEISDLDTVRAVGHGTGVYGVVASSTDLAPLRDATVRVVGGDRMIRSDSAGRFVIELDRPGGYVLRVDHSGYAVRLAAVDVQANHFARVIPLLDVQDSASKPAEKFYREFDQRVQFMSTNGALITGDALRKTHDYTISDAVNDVPLAMRHGLSVGSETCVFVNGTPQPGWSVDEFPIESVDAVELYTKTGDATGSINRLWPAQVPCTASPRVLSTKQGVTFVVVWLRGS